MPDSVSVPAPRLRKPPAPVMGEPKETAVSAPKPNSLPVPTETPGAEKEAAAPWPTTSLPPETTMVSVTETGPASTQVEAPVLMRSKSAGRN